MSAIAVPTLQLFGSPRSPFVRKVRVVLAEKRLACRWFPEPDPRLDSLNPLGKRPVLLIDDRQPLYDSRVIVEYIDWIAPAPRLLPPDGMGRIDVKRWEALADGIGDAGVAIVAEGMRSVAAERSPAWIDRQRGKIERALAAATTELGPRAWCHGDGLTLADLALAVALGYVDYRLPDIPWRDRYPNLVAFHSRLSARDSMVRTDPAAATP